MNVFVTGGTGFVGSHVVELLLEEGHRVTVLSRKTELPDAWKGREMKIVQGDLAAPEAALDAMHGADVVYHIGEIKNTSPGAARKNVDAVRKMAAEAERAGVRRFVLISSITVAGIPSTVPATEETEPLLALRDLYTEYKRKAETTVRESLSRTEHTIVRPGIVYGPRSRHLGPMLRTIRRVGPLGIPFVGLGRNHAPFVQVQDLARAVVFAGMRPEAANQTFNVTDGKPHTWKEFFSSVGQVQGRTVRIVPMPSFLLRIPAVIADLFSGVLGFDMDLHTYVTFASRDIHFDMGKAKRLLGWEQKRVDFEKAVQEMVEWYGKRNG